MRSDLKNLAIGAGGSLIASSLAVTSSWVLSSHDPVTISLAGALGLTGGGCCYFAWRYSQLRIPGYRRYLKHRGGDDFTEMLFHRAERSLEILSATGSSVFHQGGRMANILTQKFKDSTDFRLRVLLVDPDAKRLIEYRKRRLGDEKNVMGSSDINSTITLLKSVRQGSKLGPNQSFDIRTYDTELVWSIFLIDRKVALLGGYPPGKSGWKTPLLEFERSSGSYYYIVEEQFDQRWSRSKPA